MKQKQSPENKVRQFIAENSLIAGGRALLVGVSGGPDSVCLLHILADLRNELGVDLHVAHLDHQLRGAESAADAEFVARLAGSLGLPVTVGARDVGGYRAEARLSLEEAAREARYQFLAETAESVGADRVAVGHTSDDHVETILMHLIRGSGMKGLRGLQPLSVLRSAGQALTVIRPLLALTRQETADYSAAHRLEPRMDSSNQSLSPLRNRVRHQLVPLLESYNPGVKDALVRAARLAEDDLALLQEHGARLSAGIARREGQAIVFDKERFLALPVGVKRYLLRETMSDLLGDLKDVEARHIDAAITTAGKPAGRQMNLPEGLFFVVGYDRLVLAPESGTPVPLPAIEGEQVLKVPGETMFSDWRIVATVVKREEIEKPEDEFTAYLDVEAVGDRLLVRSRQTGDTFQPLGMSRTKELAEFMIDEKIPRAWRERVPVVCSRQHIVWVVGWRIDDRAKVAPDTRLALRLQFEMV